MAACTASAGVQGCIPVLRGCLNVLAYTAISHTALLLYNADQPLHTPQSHPALDAIPKQRHVAMQHCWMLPITTDHLHAAPLPMNAAHGTQAAQAKASMKHNSSLRCKLCPQPSTTAPNPWQAPLSSTLRSLHPFLPSTATHQAQQHASPRQEAQPGPQATSNCATPYTAP